MSESSPKGRLIGPKFRVGLSADYALKYKSEEREEFPPAEGIKLETPWLRAKVLEALGPRFASGSPTAVQFFDDMYYLPSLGEVEWILGRSLVSRMESIVERFDCDDFAFGMKGEFSLYAYRDNELDLGLSLGVVAGRFDWQQSAHMSCFVVDSKQDVYLIEPRRADPVNRGGKILLQAPSTCRQCNLVLL